MWRYSELSPKQKEVVELMREGWELRTGTIINPPCWLVNNGKYKFGIRYSTILALRKRGVLYAGSRINEDYQFYTLNVKEEVTK